MTCSDIPGAVPAWNERRNGAFDTKIPGKTPPTDMGVFGLMWELVSFATGQAAILAARRPRLARADVRQVG